MILSLLIFLVLSPLVKADILTDKYLYKPDDVAVINLVYTEPLKNVEIKITNPNGNLVMSDSMKNLSTFYWTYNHTLDTKSLNGTYNINITALQGVTLVNASMPILKFNKTFDVEAWKVNANLNKYYFVPKDEINLTVLITDRYSNKLTFDVSYGIIDPLENEIANYTLFLTEVNEGFYRYFEIPENYTLGISTITMNLTDSDNRKATFNLSFSVSEGFIISPIGIDEKIKKEAIERSFVFRNYRDSSVSVESVEISDDLKPIIKIIQRPYLMQPLENATMKIKIDTRKAARGIYDGTINVSVEGVEYSIYINLDVLSAELEIKDYSYIIWGFAFGIVIIIVLLTILRYRKSKKKKKEGKEEKKKKEKEKRKREEREKEIYYKVQEEYRTDYY